MFRKLKNQARARRGGGKCRLGYNESVEHHTKKHQSGNADTKTKQDENELCNFKPGAANAELAE